MRTTSSFQFYCRQSKADKRGFAPIEVSLIINQERVFISLPRKEYPETFKKLTESKRNNPLKEYLFEVRNKFNDIQTELMRNNIPLTASNLKLYYQSGGVRPYKLSDLWDEFLDILAKRVGNSITEMCYKKYVSARNTMYEIIPKETEVKALTNAMMQNLLATLQSKYKESSVAGIMTKIKTVIKFARDNNKISGDIFNGIKYSKGQPVVEFLTEDEITKIVEKHYDIERMEKVRDIAVFQISSGLAYCDCMSLKPEDIQYAEDGTAYVCKDRQKTGVEYTAPIFPEGLEILKKYHGSLPHLSNQRLNTYYKELADTTGIKKNLHSHLFRKTYACRLLNRGVRLETVSKCLGHSNTAITQSTYAKLLRNTVVQEVSAVF